LYSESTELLQKIKLAAFTSKKVKVTLKIDANAFYHFKVEQFNGNEIDEEFMKLNFNEVIPEKSEYSQKIVRIIFGENHFSIIWIPQTGCEQKILDPTGLEKIPTYIAFTAEKPICGKPAKDMFAEYPQFVVYGYFFISFYILIDIFRSHETLFCYDFGILK
uniref:Uncharacterized protein n=1 Tax=Panagrolaimus sp. PS1159 TaxID=55785 RepID=A0AC35F1F9_9BILA